MQRASIDHLVVMKISGHKAMSTSECYSTFDENDLKMAAVQMDAYMDTNEKPALIKSS